MPLNENIKLYHPVACPEYCENAEETNHETCEGAYAMAYEEAYKEAYEGTYDKSCLEIVSAGTQTNSYEDNEDSEVNEICEFETFSRSVVGTLKSSCGNFYLPNPTSPYRLSDIEGLHDRLLKLSLIDVPFFCDWGPKNLLRATCPNLKMLEVISADLGSVTDDNLELPNNLVQLALINCELSIFEILLPESLQIISLEFNYLQKIPMCIEDTLFSRELKVNLRGQA